MSRKGHVRFSGECERAISQSYPTNAELTTIVYYRLGMEASPHSSDSTKKYISKLTLGTGDKPLFLKPDMAIIVRSIVLAFRLRSRHPVRPKGRTAYNENDYKTNSIY